MSIASPNLPQASGGVAASDGGATSDDAASTQRSASRDNPFQRFAAKVLGSRLFWAIFLLVGFVGPVARVVRTALPPALPVLGTIGDFELVDQAGHAFGTAELRDKVWLASAVHTSSPSADELAKALGKIQHRVRNLGPAFHVVTVGLDPEVDAPGRLAEFTTHHRVSPRIWSFLSGDAPALHRAHAALGIAADGRGRNAEPTLSVRGGAASPEGPQGPLAIALVDGRMRVRARYDLADPTAIDTLLYHVGLLVNRGD